jgi:invasion protein IalB
VGEQSDQHISSDARTGATFSTSTPGIAYPETLSDWSVVCNLDEAIKATVAQLSRNLIKHKETTRIHWEQYLILIGYPVSGIWGV